MSSWINLINWYLMLFKEINYEVSNKYHNNIDFISQSLILSFILCAFTPLYVWSLNIYIEREHSGNARILWGILWNVKIECKYENVSNQGRRSLLRISYLCLCIQFTSHGLCTVCASVAFYLRLIYSFSFRYMPDEKFHHENNGEF